MEYLKKQKELEAIRWMNKATEIAKNALCLKDKCGTVIVKDGEVIGEGYNAPPLKTKFRSNMLHARRMASDHGRSPTESE